ncbi:hypothetical protein TNCV_2672171 [Trichonephila clavipes]|nr:hypothetical protein TNCV_2672171 [Trichonephila clavipes]
MDPEYEFTCRNCGGGGRGRVAIYRPFGEVSLSLNRTVTCMVLKANDRRTSCPCHDEFRGPRSDYVRQEWNCNMRREMQEIIPGLFLGPLACAKFEMLVEAGITHIVCVRYEREVSFMQPSFPEKFKCIVINLKDPDSSMIPIFSKVKVFVDNALKDGDLWLALALCTMQVTVQFCLVPPQFRENPGGGQGPPTSLPLPPTTREDLQLDGYLEYPHTAKALYIYKHPCLLRDSNPVPTASQSS